MYIHVYAYTYLHNMPKLRDDNLFKAHADTVQLHGALGLVSKHWKAARQQSLKASYVQARQQSAAQAQGSEDATHWRHNSEAARVAVLENTAFLQPVTNITNMEAF